MFLWGEFVSIELFEHNQIAYEKVVTMMNKTNKAAIVHPTGTGKSFIAFKLCEDNRDKIVCWISPSSYIFKTQIENVKQIYKDFSSENISFFTYSKLSLMSDDEIKKINPSYIILDEFHRAGATEWGRGVLRLLSLYKNVPLLGMSATNIRYLDEQRDMADELFEGNVASQMTLGEAIVRGILNPPKYVISMYAYEEELRKYERRLRSSKYNFTRVRAQKIIDDIRRSMDMADGMPEVFGRHIKEKDGKYIVFCSDYKHLKEMVSVSEKWFANVDENPHIYVAYSNNAETSRAFAKFKNDNSEHLKLLYCIDMLNEGIHVDDVSGVILLRPTISPIIYKQQIGRALSASGKKDTIIFDIVNNFENLSSINAIEEEMTSVMSHFRYIGDEKHIVNDRFDIIDEIRDCRELFEELERSFTLSWDDMYVLAERYFKEHGNLNVTRRYRTKEGYSLGNWIATQRAVYSGRTYGALDYEKIRRLNLIGMRWENKFDASWENFYEECKQYSEKHGNLNMNIEYMTDSGYALGKRIYQLRSYRKNGIQSVYLLKERIKQLDELGMIWDIDDYVWDKNFSAAERYFRQYGHLEVPYEYVSSDGIRLGFWIDKIRRMRRKTPETEMLNSERIDKLSKIGMRWDTKYEVAWLNGYTEARNVYEKYGHLNVNSEFVTETGYELGSWISRQKRKFSSLDIKKQELLNSMGITGKKAYSWDEKFQLAKAYYEEYLSLDIPHDYVTDGVWLGKWLTEQKQIYLGKRKGKSLTEIQIEKLNSIKISWNSKKEEIWEICFELVAEKKADKDHILPDGKRVSQWIDTQKRLYKSGKLSEYKAKRLINANIITATNDRWEDGYGYALSYYKSFGNLRVSSMYTTEEGFRLGSWISNQRTAYKKGDLSSERKQLLEKIGMVWDIREEFWEETYDALRDYYQKNGHTNIPKKHITSFGTDLYEWLRTQYKKYKNGHLPVDKIERLKKLGVKWLGNADETVA